MVPDPSAETTYDDLDPDGAYDLVYRATRDALWDVLGTATLIITPLGNG
ncbi:MAG: hypothetical protein ABEK02_06755 [Haloquadratum sp.]